MYGRSLKDDTIAPVCSGSKCYTCPEGAAVISGSVCVCNGGVPCQEVGASVNAIVADATSAASNAVSNAMEVANNAVSNAMNEVSKAGAMGGSSSSCPQHGDGQGGSRCGNEDLIGYCEDSCGSGDGACCIDNKPVCAC